METILQDLRYAWRQLRKAPGFSVAAILILALGVGANAGVFTLANWILLSPTPGVRDESRLATVFFPQGVSIPNFRSVSEQLTAFSATAGQDTRSYVLEERGRPARFVRVGVVSRNYFELLGAGIGPGGAFTAEEYAASSGAPVAVISHALWRGSFGADPAIVGRPLRLNAVTVTIVGVAARGFEGTARPGGIELWLPYPAVAALARPGPFSADRQVPDFSDPGQAVFQEIVGRLAPGATLAQAQEQLRTALRSSPQEEVQRARVRGAPPPSIRAGVGVREFTRDQFGQTVRVLGAVAAVVLLLAMANLGNLMLFRAIRRREELVVRRALGASTGRLARQSLIESLLLAVVGTAVALLFAVGLQGLFGDLAIPGLPAFEQAPVDHRVVLFGLSLALGIALLVGLVPPYAVARLDLATALKSSAAKGSGSRMRVRNAMTVIQLSACLSLLVSAFLLVATLRNLQAVDLGFDPSGVDAFSVDAGSVGYTPEQTYAFHQQAMDRIRAIPGVERVAMAPMTPFGGGGSVTGVSSDALPPGERRGAWVAVVSPDYFALLRIPIVRGRPFTEFETSSSPGAAAPVVIVGEKLAQQLFGTSDPVGQVVRPGMPNLPGWEVVGVARESRWYTVVGSDMARAGTSLYFPLGAQFGPRSLRAQFLVRRKAGTRDLTKSVLAVFADLAPSVPVVTESMSSRIDRTLAQQRLFAKAVGTLTVLALLLAGVGLYGLVGFSVAERTKELGIRIALGAQAREVVDLVLRQGALLAAAGLGLGLVGAFGLSRLLASRLFGVTPLEPYVYVGATGLLVLVVLVASLVPARAATRVDPLIALRSE